MTNTTAVIGAFALILVTASSCTRSGDVQDGTGKTLNQRRIYTQIRGLEMQMKQVVREAKALETRRNAWMETLDKDKVATEVGDPKKEVDMMLHEVKFIVLKHREAIRKARDRLREFRTSDRIRVGP